MGFTSKILKEKFDMRFNEQIDNSKKFTDYAPPDPDDYFLKELAIGDYYGEILGCSCGSPDETIEFMYHVLTYANDRNCSLRDLKKKFGFDDNNDMHTAAIEIILKMIDNLGWLEHGSSIWGSWLTDLGKDHYEAITELRQYSI